MLATVCGLAGVLDWSSSGDDELVRALIGELTHRGPDGMHVGDYAPLHLGHARLSILDTSDRADQPMVSSDGRYVAVHNGEIYNFLELADELRALGRAFRTRSDTEVILEAYAEWGAACVERFNGIWAFALWDRQQRRLLLSRDRLGVKPLFLAKDGSKLAFASEIKALLRLPWLDRRPDPRAVNDFLLDARLDHGRETFFAGIERLPPGHNLIVDPHGYREIRYWAPAALTQDSSDRANPADAESIAAIRRAVIDSVSLQLRSDVPIGSCLSGGLDSSTIVAVASALRSGRLRSDTVANHDRDQTAQVAFFADFADPGISERPFVDQVVESTGVSLRAVTPSSDAALASLESIVRAQDEPFGSTSIVAQYHVMKLVHEAAIPVLLDGQGADELFGGYPAYRAHRDAELLKTRRAASVLTRGLTPTGIGPLARAMWSLGSGGAPPPTGLRRSRALRPFLGQAVKNGARIVPTWTPRNGTNLGRALWRDLSWGHLPGLLRYEDRNSMAFGIEARVPYLDHKLVELALGLPDRLKINGQTSKVALRAAFADIVPGPVLARRDKIGFASPESRWLHDWRPAIAKLQDKPRSEALGLIKPGALSTLSEMWSSQQLARDVFWRVLSLELWARVSVAEESLPFASD